MPPSIGSSVSDNQQWDIVWASDINNSKQLDWVYVDDDPLCVITPTGGAGNYNGYLPNSNTQKIFPLSLNGILIDASSINQHVNFISSCQNTCYASWKKGNTNTSVSEFQNTEELKIELYPNPTNVNFTVESNQLIEQIEIYNVVGELIYTQHSNGKSVLIQPPYIASGVYQIIISTSNQKIHKPLTIIR